MHWIGLLRISLFHLAPRSHCGVGIMQHDWLHKPHLMTIEPIAQKATLRIGGFVRSGLPATCEIEISGS